MGCTAWQQEQPNTQHSDAEAEGHAAPAADPAVTAAELVLVQVP